MAEYFLAEAYNTYHIGHIGLYSSLELAQAACLTWFEHKVQKAIEENPATYWGENPPAAIEWGDGVENEGYGEQGFAVLTGQSNYTSICDIFIISRFEVDNG